MKPRTLILLMVAVGCGLVAAFLTSQLAGQKAETIELPVASRELRQGEYLREPEKLFVPRKFVRGSEPPGAIGDIEQLRNKQLQRTVDGGQVVTPRDLGATEGMAKNLPDGYRAMTIRVTVDSAVQGFILPGSHVDLITNVESPKDKRLTMSKIFMQNMLVLAVNTEDVRPENAKVMATPAFVTLAVKPDEAERLTRVTTTAVPTMVMRKPGDDKPTKTQGATTPFGQAATDETDRTTKDVPVAKKDIMAGTAITKDNLGDFFEVRPQLADAIPANAITELDKLMGVMINRPLGTGSVCTTFYLTKDAAVIGEAPIFTAPPPKQHVMKIYQGDKPVQQITFEAGVAREFAPGPNVVPPGAKEAPGSEGK